MAEVREIYRSERTDTTYSMLEVPTTTVFQIQYQRPSVATYLTLIPSEAGIHLWRAQGFIDEDIVENFGFPMAKQKQGDQVPEVTTRKVNDIRKLDPCGYFYQFSDSQPPQLWFISLRLDESYIDNLLHRIWTPQLNPEYPSQVIPPITLDFTNKRRKLPQKFPKDSSLARLEVIFK